VCAAGVLSSLLSAGLLASQGPGALARPSPLLSACHCRGKCGSFCGLQLWHLCGFSACMQPGLAQLLLLMPCFFGAVSDWSGAGCRHACANIMLEMFFFGKSHLVHCSSRSRGAKHAPDSLASAHGRKARVARRALLWLCMNAPSRPCCSSSRASCSMANAASARLAPSACSCCLLSRFRSCQPAPSLLSLFVSLPVRRPCPGCVLPLSLLSRALLWLRHCLSADVDPRAAVNVLLFLQPPRSPPSSRSRWRACSRRKSSRYGWLVLTGQHCCWNTSRTTC